MIPENALELGLTIPTYQEIMQRNADAERAKQNAKNNNDIEQDLDTIQRITANDSEHFSNQNGSQGRQEARDRFT